MEIVPVLFYGNWHMILDGPIIVVVQWAGMGPGQSKCFPGIFQSEARMEVPFPIWSLNCMYMRTNLPENMLSASGISQAKKIKLVQREKWRLSKKRENPDGIYVFYYRQA